MNKQLSFLLVAVMLLLMLPGCPTAVSALVGSWIITSNSMDFGLQLNANGQAVPFMLDGILAGTFTWEVDGTRVLLHQVSGNNKLVWAAELTSETAMTGAFVFWTGSAGTSDTFTAVKQ